MTRNELELLLSRWDVFAHDHQVPLTLAPNGQPWLTWLLIGGRGAGKTRAGAEWVRAQALGLPPMAAEAVTNIALVGETEHDVREVMVEGISRLLAVHRRDERPVWTSSRRRLEWSNGAVAYAFSAEDPESLRGPQFGCAWSDEMAKWRYAQATFDMLQFGLRLGSQPRQLITTTPRPTALIKRLHTRALNKRDGCGRTHIAGFVPTPRVFLYRAPTRRASIPRWSANTARTSRACRREIPMAGSGRAEVEAAAFPAPHSRWVTSISAICRGFSDLFALFQITPSETDNGDYTQLAGDVPAGDSPELPSSEPPDIPREMPKTSAERTGVMRAVANWLEKILA